MYSPLGQGQLRSPSSSEDDNGYVPLDEIATSDGNRTDIDITTEKDENLDNENLDNENYNSNDSDDSDIAAGAGLTPHEPPKLLEELELKELEEHCVKTATELVATKGYKPFKPQNVCLFFALIAELVSINFIGF